MNLPAALISVGIGVAFFAAGSVFTYRPDLPKVDTQDLLAPNHTKARAAVSRLLIHPASAEFTNLRSVQLDAASYVCGNVNATDRSGAYVGYRAFVYTVAIDFARIDDAEQIAQKHDAYRACPVTDNPAPGKQPIEISPNTLKIASAIQKSLPTMDTSALSTVASQMAPAGGSPGGSMEQQIGKLAAQSGSIATQRAITLGQPTAGQQTSLAQQANASPKPTADKVASNTKAMPFNEKEWSSDRPPAAWPVFPPEHPLAKTGRKRPSTEAIAAAKDVEDRLTRSVTGHPATRPSSSEIHEALRSLLLIDPKSEDFPQAWAAFVRLRKIQRDAGA